MERKIAVLKSVLLINVFIRLEFVCCFEIKLMKCSDFIYKDINILLKQLHDMLVIIKNIFFCTLNIHIGGNTLKKHFRLVEVLSASKRTSENDLSITSCATSFIHFNRTVQFFRRIT